MAELTEETVQKLNQVLSRLASGGGGDAPPEGGTDMSEQAADADKAADRFSNLREQIDELEGAFDRQSTTQSKMSREMETGAGIAQQYQDSILGVGSAFQSMISYMPKSIGQIAGMAKEMFSFKGILNTVGMVLIKIVSNTLEFALSVDKAAASFRAATGAGYGYEKVISAAGAAYLTYGINAGDAASASS